MDRRGVSDGMVVVLSFSSCSPKLSQEAKRMLLPSPLTFSPAGTETGGFLGKGFPFQQAPKANALQCEIRESELGGCLCGVWIPGAIWFLPADQVPARAQSCHSSTSLSFCPEAPKTPASAPRSPVSKAGQRRRGAEGGEGRGGERGARKRGVKSLSGRWSLVPLPCPCISEMLIKRRFPERDQHVSTRGS